MSGAAFGACLGAAFFVFIYYVPIWFQAIKGVSAVGSGIRNIPMILGNVIVSVIGGVLITVIGYFAPFAYISAALMSIGAGLLTTLTPESGAGEWIGYQVIFGAGVGAGFQLTLISTQAVLEKKDVPIATAMMMFCTMLGGALFVSVGQNTFTTSLIKNLAKVVPDVDPQTVLSAGATDLAAGIPAKYLPAVKLAYNSALINTFYVGLAMALLSTFGAAFFEWKNIKGKKIEMGGA